MTSRDIPTSRRSSARKNEALSPGLDNNFRKGIWPRSLPLWMAGFYVSLFILKPWDQLLPRLGAIHFARIYAVCMIIVVLVSPRKRLKLSFMTFAVLYFYFTILISGIFAWNPSLAWAHTYVYTTLIVFYFVLITVILSEYDLLFIIICYVLSMAIYLAKAQWEFFINNHHVYRMGVTRLTGIESMHGAPNSLAMSIVASLPMLLFLWVYRKEVSSEWPNIWQKLFSRGLVIYAFLAVSSIVLTNSRTGMAAFTLFVILSIGLGKGVGRIIKSAVLGVIILGIIWQVMPESNKNRFRTLWNPAMGPANAEASAEGRLEGFKAGIEMFKRRPILGVGVGNFKAYRVRFVDGDGHSPHNLIGQVLGETGALGFSAFVLLVITTLVNCKKVKVLAKGRSDPPLIVLSGLTFAIRNSLILLLFAGLAGHNLLRFNWLWLAAFSTLSFMFASEYVKKIKQI